MNSRLTRRSLIKSGAAAALAAPLIIPSRLLGQDAPSKHITLGVIGTGGKGRGGMQNFMACPNAQIVAVCDVNRQHRDLAGDLAKIPAQSRYNDFREMLARKDIDAVLVASTDHWHTLHAKAVIESGKDVYCEKPMSNTIAESHALVEAVRQRKAVFQHGTQLRSQRSTHRVCTLVRNKVIGDVKQVTIGSPPGLATGDHAPEPVPDFLDWNLFQGPAPEKPHPPWRWDRLAENQGCATWYFISDYSKSGWIGGFAVHDIDLALWGLGITNEGPVAIEGKGVFPSSGLFDTVLTYELHFTWPDGRRITVTDTGRNPHGVKFHGDKDWLFCRTGMEASNMDILRTPLEGLKEQLYQSDNHEANFLECCRTRKETITPVEAGQRTVNLCLAGAICLRLGRSLKWDPKTERFDDEEANKHLSYPMRAPWTL